MHGGAKVIETRVLHNYIKCILTNISSRKTVGIDAFYIYYCYSTNTTSLVYILLAPLSLLDFLYLYTTVTFFIKIFLKLPVIIIRLMCKPLATICNNVA